MRWPPDLASLASDPLSAVLWFSAVALVLYFARRPAHEAIRAGGRGFRNGMRLTARSLLAAERALVSRNREVLLADGAESTEREIEREFTRIAEAVQLDVASFPALQRRLSDLTTSLDEDYRASGDVPPSPPGWVDAVQAVAKLSHKSDAPVASILEHIHSAAETQHKEAIAEYRRGTAERHDALDKMQPRWRTVAATLTETAKQVAGVQQRSRIVDGQMDRYEQIRGATDRAERVLSSSALIQLAISALVLAIAFGGAVINFNLIALPMSEMVGGGSYIGDWKTSDVAAMVIILVEVAMGLYLMEALRITRLFPVIGQLDDRMRRRMAWIAFGLLFVLAGIEASLAFMRDRIAADMQMLRQALANVDAPERPHSNIPTAGQMLMGFILPFALTFVAIPLETFVHSVRHVLGAGLGVALRWTAFALRLLGNMAAATAELLVRLYDLIVCLPLWIERAFKRLGRGKSKDDTDAMISDLSSPADTSVAPSAQWHREVATDQADEGAERESATQEVS